MLCGYTNKKMQFIFFCIVACFLLSAVCVQNYSPHGTAYIELQGQHLSPRRGFRINISLTYTKTMSGRKNKNVHKQTKRHITDRVQCKCWVIQG